MSSNNNLVSVSEAIIDGFRQYSAEKSADIKKEMGNKRPFLIRDSRNRGRMDKTIS